MKISITSQGSAKIFLSTADMKKLGFTPQELITGSSAAQLFISGTAAFLSQLGLIDLSAGEVSCGVTEVFDGIVFELSSGETETEQTELTLAFDDPQQLKSFCGALPCHITEKLRFCQLYKLQGRYFLLCGLDRSQSWAMSQSALNGAVFDEVKLQKIREYGELLSRTPIETIRKLTDP